MIQQHHSEANPARSRGCILFYQQYSSLNSKGDHYNREISTISVANGQAIATITINVATAIEVDNVEEVEEAVGVAE
ncbi:hypothetical protein OUZ56_026340 [Daphnia magna]|uniref:Uncharacterized protein n=1 Tax=Daphnia magna TaxID=35525 RepID=A0ABQ9ZLH6_9CRUS|nr:hypothetical protein OUZ56_026340 [Daphnia magna]